MLNVRTVQTVRTARFTDCERPFAGPVYADAHIEYWAEHYLARPALARRMSFAQFLAGQMAIRSSLLLPEQLDLRAQIAKCERAMAALERAGASTSNGRIIEKLRHHRHPSARQSSFRPEAR